jgi:hypothetical protein
MIFSGGHMALLKRKMLVTISMVVFVLFVLVQTIVLLKQVIAHP